MGKSSEEELRETKRLRRGFHSVDLNSHLIKRTFVTSKRIKLMNASAIFYNASSHLDQASRSIRQTKQV